MCSDCPASTDPNIGDGMLVYNKYTSGSAPTFSVGANGDIILKGTPQAGTWGGILFFQDHTAPAVTHSLGGGGDLQLQGTLYITNTAARTNSSAGFTWYQSIDYRGNSSSATFVRGQIITDVLSLGGTADLYMQLEPQGFLKVRQVALIN